MASGKVKWFDELHQVAIATEMDTLININGTVNPYLNAPAQVVRMRLLNASSMRSYMFGFSNSLNGVFIMRQGGSNNIDSI